jgi:hypothetical protein
MHPVRTMLLHFIAHVLLHVLFLLWTVGCCRCTVVAGVVLHLKFRCSLLALIVQSIALLSP